MLPDPRQEKPLSDSGSAYEIHQSRNDIIFVLVGAWSRVSSRRYENPVGEVDMKRSIVVVGVTTCIAGAAFAQVAGIAPSKPDPRMSFFVTSAGSGRGADLGGLAGADKMCSDLAAAAGARPRVWRAYLSAAGGAGRPAVNARDRIGRGPWYNARGDEVGRSVADLHRPGSPINKETVLDERGQPLNGRGDTPNRHDILTGSNKDGTLFRDATCNDWTSGGAGTARLGHFDRTGGGDSPNSWNSAHSSKSCSLPDLQATGGDGRFFCFAAR
jgi:hypothetical protein